MVARKAVMEAVMENHSLFFNGGDIEIGTLSDMMGYKVGHLPMVFYTDVPSTFRQWVNQRRSWTCGMFRHAVINLHLNLRHPFHFLYYTVVIYFLYPFKILEILTHVHLLPLIMILYVAATYIANWKVRSKWMLIFPAYALFQVLVVVWLGMARYVNTFIKTGNRGTMAVKYNPIRKSFLRRWSEAGTLLGNFVVILMAVFVITVAVFDSFQHIVFQQPYRVIGFNDNLAYHISNFAHWLVTGIIDPTRKAFWLILFVLPLVMLVTRLAGHLSRELQRPDSI
jgi:hypothetical protein